MSTESTRPEPEQVEPTQVFETSPPFQDEATRAFETADPGTGWTASQGLEHEEAPVLDRSRIRPGTVVWGLVVALVGIATLGWSQGLRFDVQLASIGVLAAAGLLLVVSAVARHRKA